MFLFFFLEENYFFLLFNDLFVLNELGLFLCYGCVKGYDEEFDLLLESKYKCIICYFGF